MRACFLGQNVTALGYGFAMLQTPPLVAEPSLENQWRSQAEPQRPLQVEDAPQKAPEPPKTEVPETPVAA